MSHGHVEESTIDFPALEELFRLLVRDPKVKDETSTEIARAAIYEACRDADEKGRYKKAVPLCGRLLKSLPKEDETRLIKTRFYLLNKLFESWSKIGDQETEEAAAKILIAQPYYFGDGPIVNEWKNSVKQAMHNCYDRDKLVRLLMLCTDGNKELYARAFHRYIELIKDADIRVFLAGCINAIGMHADKAGPMIVSYIEETSAMLDEVRGFWPIFWPGKPHNLKEEVISSRHIRFVGYVAFKADTAEKDRQEKTKWLAGIAEYSRNKWKPEDPQKRNFRIDLVIKIVPYSFGWEHKINELTPIGTIEETV